MYNYCDCKDFKGKINLRKANNGQNKMRITTTDHTGVCLSCGHFAIQNRDRLTDAYKRSMSYNISAGKQYITKYLRD